MAEIQRADDHSRRRVIVVLIVTSLGGVVLLVQLESWLTAVREMPTEAAQESLTRVFSWCVGIGSLAPLLTGCRCWWGGRRVLAWLRFPLPGARVLRDTVILSGQAAASRGMLLQAFGIILILCAASVAAVSWWVLKKFGSI
ncbi:MAG: hypothetical protein U0236_07425 [Nitrospira sp.]